MPNFSKKPKTTAPAKGLNAIPWEEAHECYTSAANLAEKTSRAEHESIVQERLEQMERNYNAQNPESGAYEGNFSDHIQDADYNEENLPQLRDKAGQTALKTDFVDKYGLIDHAHVYMPEIVTMLAGMTLNRNSNGLISGLQFRNKHFGNDRKLRGIYRFIMLDAKSSYLKTQYKGTNANYCALVPLIMYAHKLVHNVRYSEWDPEEIHFVTHSQLAEAMLWEHEPISTEVLLRERAEGLKIRSGEKQGESWNPVWKHRLYGPQLKEGPLADAPYLAQVMLTQIWCAHPENRSAYMVLDPANWDRVPPPLIAKDVVTVVPTQKSIIVESDLSW